MVQANDKPDKTLDRLTKKLNKLKTDLNNEGHMDTDLSQRQIRSRTIVVPTPRVPNASQMTTLDTTVPQSITPQVEQVQSSHLHFTFIILTIAPSQEKTYPRHCTLVKTY